MANELILGDNLEILKGLSDNSVDLCYIDPPFFSNRNYEVIWGDTGEIASFKDRWAGGIEHYINWFYERVAEIFRRGGFQTRPSKNQMDKIWLMN